MHQPRKPHLDAAHRLLRYLKKSPGQVCFLPPRIFSLLPILIQIAKSSLSASIGTI